MFSWVLKVRIAMKNGTSSYFWCLNKSGPSTETSRVERLESNSIMSKRKYPYQLFQVLILLKSPTGIDACYSGTVSL